MGTAEIMDATMIVEITDAQDMAALIIADPIMEDPTTVALVMDALTMDARDIAQDRDTIQAPVMVAQDNGSMRDKSQHPLTEIHSNGLEFLIVEPKLHSFATNTNSERLATQ